MDLELRDRVCVVTGSTAGIGLETTRLLIAEGARLVSARSCTSGPTWRGRESPRELSRRPSRVSVGSTVW
jgi:NAD(P)-dependent dehydrogenase (short-subunit alcohol dehydrogenase family)